jgi:hypothetical protein
MQEVGPASAEPLADVVPVAVEDRFETIRQPGPPEADPAGQGSRNGFYRYGRHASLSLHMWHKHTLEHVTPLVTRHGLDCCLAKSSRGLCIQGCDPHP